MANWHDGFTLRSVWTPVAETNGRYRLSLVNRTAAPVEGFRLGFSGPVRVNEAANVSNGQIIAHLSNYTELAPPSGFVLQADAAWDVEVDKLDFPLRHWTDGAVTGFLIYSDGSAAPAVTHPVL